MTPTTWTSCSGTGAALGVPTIQCFEVIFANVVAALGGLVALIFFVMLLVGGFKWLTASGDPKKTESAKGTLTMAVAGIILLIVAFLVLRILSVFTGLPLTIFTIPTNLDTPPVAP